LCAQMAKFTLLSKKHPFLLEGKPKKQAFASHGDFRRYLYEALVMSMPVSLVKSDKVIIEGI
jgi:hypothetical protein